MYDVIVIGGGPAGMMAALSVINQKKVLLIDKNEKLGKKLEITGGGRCNLLNLKTDRNFIDEVPVNSKFLYSIFNQCNPDDLYKFFTQKGILLKTEDNNRVFPVTNKSSTIIDCLINELKLNKVDIKLEETVKQINLKNETKEIITNKGKYKSYNIIIATGGKSYPETGSSGDGYSFASKMGHNLIELYPAETYVITKEKYPLSGITLEDVEVKFGKIKVRSSMLFTHKGLSGPGILKISEYVYKESLISNLLKLKIDLLPNYKFDDLLELLDKYDIKKETNSFLKQFLPKRLSDYIIEKNSLNFKIGNMSKEQKFKTIDLIKNFEVIIKETGPLKTSFVTGGGVDLKQINPKTLESKLRKGIYFIGEVLDIHGPIGGYNITIALATGYVAGKSASK